MRKRRKPLVSALVVTTMVGDLTVACSSQPNTASNTSDNKNTSAAGTATTYPMKTDKTLSYWGELPGNLTGVKSQHGDVPFFQEWQKQTGVKLKFTTAPTNQGKEALNVMLASGDLPDMIEYDFLGAFPGGPEKAIKDGYILKLNDVIDKYAPNLKKYLKEHPEIDKMVKTDNGGYYAFPFLRGDPALQVYQGPIIRKDWLDELGLPIPETIDDWYTTLKAFKEKKGAAAPSPSSACRGLLTISTPAISWVLSA
ncbi:extracellular solute-binding protein [Paenibacillus sp. P26]|nr:extracellular solute-binding protein [Paenibacillus sp. P26]